METKVFRLKNMLSRSCIKLVQLSLKEIKGIEVVRLRMGWVELKGSLEAISSVQWDKHFEGLGFEILRDPDAELVERIKQAAVELIMFDSNKNSLVRNSDYISEKVQLPYDKISKKFSAYTHSTLEKYLILLKIERAKELIEQGSVSLSEIAFMLGYSSVQYLSNQFKKTTGLTISDFRENPAQYRKAIEDLI